MKFDSKISIYNIIESNVTRLVIRIDIPNNSKIIDRLYVPGMPHRYVSSMMHELVGVAIRKHNKEVSGKGL